MNSTNLFIESAGNGPRIQFEKVCLMLGGNSILDEVDFVVEPGSIHCLIGPNGGGKTSLLRSLLGQMPHSGTIKLGWSDGEVIGYVPQMLDFDRTLPITVDDFMAMTCQTRPAFFGIGSEFRIPIGRILDKVGLAEKRYRILGQLSGGEMQRLLLAQALLPAPNLLVLDEPATGLDEKGATILRNLLRELKTQGVTIFWIHHDLQEVREMADFVTCINRRVIFSGRPVEVLNNEQILSAFSARSYQNTGTMP